MCCFDYIDQLGPGCGKVRWHESPGRAPERDLCLWVSVTTLFQIWTALLLLFRTVSRNPLRSSKEPSCHAYKVYIYYIHQTGGGWFMGGIVCTSIVCKACYIVRFNHWTTHFWSDAWLTQYACSVHCVLFVSRFLGEFISLYQHHNCNRSYCITTHQVVMWLPRPSQVLARLPHLQLPSCSQLMSETEIARRLFWRQPENWHNRL